MIGALALIVALAVSGFLFARRVLLLSRLVRMGHASGIERRDDVPDRLRSEAVVVLGQRKLLQRLVPGLMHAFIFWAFIVLFPAIPLAMIAMVDADAAPHWEWYEALANVFCVLALVGVVVAFYIRKVVRPRRFDGSHLGEADLILAWIAGICLHCWRTTSPTRSPSAWAHVLLILGFLAYLPHSKHLHIATAAINVYFGRTRSRGRLEPLKFDEELPEEEMRFGIGTVEDLTWKQMMDAFSCTECGRCQDACPAYFTGKALSPKLVIMGVRDHLFAEGPKALAGDYEGTAGGGDGAARGDGLGLHDLRRVRGGVPGRDRAHPAHRRHAPPRWCWSSREFPSELAADRSAAPSASRTRGASPPTSARTGPKASTCRRWPSSSDDERVEYLYWVGCAGAFDDRNQEDRARRCQAPEGRRRRLRDPRPRGGVHRRAGAARSATSTSTSGSPRRTSRR